MGYIMDLRRHVGHAPLMMPSAGVILVNARGEILMQRRADDGSWCCCGGALTTMLVGVLYARHFLAITCAAAFMMLVVRVIKNAFEQAILMKDELDLTV